MAEPPKNGVRKVVFLTEVDFSLEQHGPWYRNLLFFHKESATNFSACTHILELKS